MKLFRPHIPIDVKIAVAQRQARAYTCVDYERVGREVSWPKPRFLAFLLTDILDLAKPRLDHDPPLGLRKFNKRTKTYTPAANDPKHLFWIEDDAHDVKTNGPGGDKRITTAGSDVHKIAKARRIEREQTFKIVKGRKRTGSIAARLAAWPKNRKIQSRGFR